MRRAALAAAVAMVLAHPAIAAAHEERAVEALPVLIDVAPDIEGLEIFVVHLTAPALVVRNHTDRTFTLTADDGTSLLRVGSGRVELNAAEPDAYRTLDPFGPHAAPRGGPRWSVIAHRRTWSWFDPRMVYRPHSPHWDVSARLGTTPIAISGTFESLDGHGHFRAVLDEPNPMPPGLTVRLVQGRVPAVYVRNDTTEVLSIPGRDGEEFLRIGPRGVYANLNSPTYYLAGGQVIRPVPASADSTKPPRWQQVSAIPVWAWLEYQAQVPALAEQRSVLGKEPSAILRWTTEARLGSHPLAIGGRVLWVPPASSSDDEGGAPVWISAALGAGVAVAATRLIRRRA
jgi:MYXO-CTERM domain-containing protein